MDRRTRVALSAGLAALPGLVLAAAGLLHPHSLGPSTADTWFRLHLVALFVFPLVGVGLVVPLLGRRDVVAWLVRGAAYVYATAYTALDVISGIAAGWVTSRLADPVPRPEEVSLLFRIGTPVGEVGSWALLLATALLALDAVRRSGVPAVVLLVLPVGAWLVHRDHIFAPTGLAGMALVGVGSGLAVALARSPRQRDTRSGSAREATDRGPTAS